MVKQHIALAVMLIFIAMSSYARAKEQQPTAHEFLGSYATVKFIKIDGCNSSATKERARANSNKIIILSKEFACDFSRKIQNPQYAISQQTPIMEEGEVYPEYVRYLFDINGDYEDQLTLLTISRRLTNTTFAHFEIIDNDTLLYSPGCWVYTLKRIK